MVADEVVVETRRAGTEEAWRWSSDGQGVSPIAPLPLADAPARGARVILHLNEASHDYLEPHRLERIVREHSGAVAVPIDLVDKPGAEPRRVADGAAIWAKPKTEVTRRGIRRILSQPVGPVRRAGADRALARRGPARIYGAGVRAGLAAVRSVRSGAQEPQQALCPARADHPGRRPAARLAALRPAGRRQRRSAAQRLARNDPAERRLRRDPQGRDQSRGAGADQARRERSRNATPRSGRISARCSRRVSTKTPSGATRLFKLARFTTTTHPAGDRTLADYVAALTREPDGDLLSHRRGRQAARRQPAARRVSRPRRRGAVARRSGRRLLGVDRGRLRRQAVQVGQPGRRRHQGDRPQGRRRRRPPRPRPRSRR